MIRDRQLKSDLKYYLTGNGGCPSVTSLNLEACQDAASFLAEICGALNNDAKDKLIRFQEVVYEASLAKYENGVAQAYNSHAS